MRILLLSNPNSSHTIKWAKALAKEGLEIYIFGIDTLSVNDYKEIENIKIETLKSKNITLKKEGAIEKIVYLKALPLIKKIIKEFKPDILHAHYATSYGLLGALSGFKPFILSVWGSDVFSFPNKSILHKKILEYNLNKATKVLSTSNIMAKEIKKYTTKKVDVIPFGIDIDSFKPIKVNTIFDKEDIVIGTIKALEKEYGIEYLIEAFKILTDKYPHLPLRLLIVGKGSLQKVLKDLVKDLNIQDKVIFTGAINYNKVPIYHNMITIFVALSNSESFGVSILEASACKKPVVVSNAGGLVEVVEDNSTGLVTLKQNPTESAKAIEKLILNKDLREQMGKAGRQRVKELYNWQKNIKQMINIYKGLK